MTISKEIKIAVTYCIGFILKMVSVLQLSGHTGKDFIIIPCYDFMISVLILW